MRDPGLVQRAERAAIALERAWGQWRSQHGLGAQPPTPVSSYVGYSLEEPWGQPRVVFGVAAEEAEMLTALLDGHDCVGLVHAEMTDWRHSSGSHPAVPSFPADDRLAVAARATSAAESVTSADEQAEPEPVEHEPAQCEAPERRPAEEQAVRPDRLVRAAISAFWHRADHEPIPLEVVPLEELAPLPPADTGGEELDVPSHGPGYGGPRYQGFPPQYHTEGPPYNDADGTARFDSDVAADDDFAGGSAGDQFDRPVHTLVSRLSRSRRSQRGAHEAGTWAEEQERQQAVADSAV